MRKVSVFTRLVAVVVAAIAVSGLVAAEERSPNADRFTNATGVVLFSDKGDNSATGELISDVMQTSLTVQREFRRTLPSIINYSQTAHTQVSDDVLASTVCPTSMCAPNNRWVMWDTPFMVKDTKKRDGGYLGYENSISGFATGISRMFDETTSLGLAVGYDYRKLDGRDEYYMKDRADAFHAALYGGTAWRWFFLDAYAGYSRTWHRTERFVYDTGGAGTNDRNKGNFNDTILSGGLKASYVCILPNEMRITPSLGIDYSFVQLGGSTESGWREVNGVPQGPDTGTTRLQWGKTNYHNVAVPAMVSLNKTYCMNFLNIGGVPSLWTPEIRGGYVAQFGAKRTGVKFHAPKLGPEQWKARSAEIGGYGTVGAGLKIKIKDKFIFGVDYNYSFASKYNNHSITGTYGVSF